MIKILGKHSKDCYAKKHAEEGLWKNAWCEAGPTTKFGAKNHPNRHGYTVWLIFGCNCTSCLCKLAVSSDDLVKDWPKS